MKMIIKSIHNLLDQKGYVRLYTGLIIASVIALTGTLYQVYLSNQRSDGGLLRRTVIAQAFTEGQLFPQTLPELDQGVYELSIESANQLYAIAHFRMQDGRVFDVMSNTFLDRFSLPEGISTVDAAQIAIKSSPNASSRSVFMRGERVNDRVVLSIPFLALDETSGQYMLATPTDNNSFVNERSGAWFGDVLRNESALSLPRLPEGWVYEGWLTVDGNPFTTGRFVSGNERDAFNGFSDDAALGPSFPGEDLLQDPPVAVFPNASFPVELRGQDIAISIEPGSTTQDPTGQAPFSVTLLSDAIGARAQSYQLESLEVVSSDDLPKTTFVLR